MIFFLGGGPPGGHREFVGGGHVSPRPPVATPLRPKYYTMHADVLKAPANVIMRRKQGQLNWTKTILTFLQN